MSADRRFSRRARSVLAVGGVLLLCAAAGFLAYRLFGEPGATGLHPVPSGLSVEAIPGAPPSEPAGALPRPKAPETLPDIDLPGTDGKIHRLREWRGRPLVINFWATWCEPCRREIPLLKALRAEHAANGLEIVGIAVDYADAVRKYASAHGMDYPLLVGEREGLEAAQSFGMETVLPFSVFTDDHDRIVTLKVGELHRDEAELILDLVHQVDAGKLSLPRAQAEIREGLSALRGARVENAP